MGLFSSFKPKSNINWTLLTELEQLDQIIESSKTQSIVILKHSTRCSISIMAKSRLDKNWNEADNESPFYYLDLIKYRPISNQIQAIFNVRHQSPQILIIKNGVCTYSETHSNINPRDIKKAL